TVSRSPGAPFGPGTSSSEGHSVPSGFHSAIVTLSRPSRRGGLAELYANQNTPSVSIPHTRKQPRGSDDTTPQENDIDCLYYRKFLRHQVRSGVWRVFGEEQLGGLIAVELSPSSPPLIHVGVRSFAQFPPASCLCLPSVSFVTEFLPLRF